MAVTGEEVSAIESEITALEQAFSSDEVEGLRAKAGLSTLSFAAKAEADMSLAALLVYSPLDEQVSEGVELLSAVNTRSMPEDAHADCFYLRAVGLMRLGRFSQAREAVREMTDSHPAFMRGVALREVLSKRVKHEGSQGMVMLVAAAAVLLAVGVAAAYTLWPSSTPAQGGRTSTGSDGHRRYVSGLRRRGYRFE